MKKIILLLMASVCFTTFATASTQCKSISCSEQIQLCVPQVSFETPTIENGVFLLECSADSMQCYLERTQSFTFNIDYSPGHSDYSFTFTKPDGLKPEYHTINTKVPVFLLSKKASKKYLRVALLENDEPCRNKHFSGHKRRG